MEVVERKRSKGGFLNLFDWHGKSRKKLFENSSESSEESRKARENVRNSSMSQLSVTEVDEYGKSSIYNLRSDSSCCASSVTSEDGQGTRAPSVVARLMGLESLPVPNSSEQLNSDLDPFFLRSSHRVSTWDRYKNLGYINHRNDADGLASDHMDSRMVKEHHNWPIERFQTETLPPRSAKPISVTHNRLLSPIRSPGFVPSKSPAYVMEAASRMIEPGPRVLTRPRVSPLGPSSSVPSRIRDLKEKVEAGRKTSNPRISDDTNKNSKYLREKHEKRSKASLVNTRTGQLSGKGKSCSSSGQAKSSVLSQDCPTSSNGHKRIPLIQKGHAEAKNRVVKSQNGDSDPSPQAGKISLKQNNQKQNCRDRHQGATSSVPVQQCKKPPNKFVESQTKSVSKKSGGNDVPLSLSQKKNLNRNKKPPNGLQERGISNGKQIRRGEKGRKGNVAIDSDLLSGKDDRKNDMDVISFTFSSPIKGLSTSRSSTQGTEHGLDMAVSFNVIGGDTLNVLLEEKLRELTSKIESSSCSLILENSLGSTSKKSVNTIISSNSIHNGLSESESASGYTLLDDSLKVQMSQSEEHESSSLSTMTEADDSALSSSRSCLDCGDKTSYGMKQSSSDEEVAWISTSEAHPAEDISESIAAITLSEAEEEERVDWERELEYITEIVSSDQLLLKEFALGMAENVLPVSLFHETDSHGDPTAKIERKMLFDCVNQFLSLKCDRIFTGSCKGIVGKHGILFERRDWLAEELNREIQGLKKEREMMVDELVDNDMSSYEGRWVEYEKEAYEEGIEMERDIVSALVDDLVDDLIFMF